MEHDNPTIRQNAVEERVQFLPPQNQSPPPPPPPPPPSWISFYGDAVVCPVVRRRTIHATSMSASHHDAP